MAESISHEPDSSVGGTTAPDAGATQPVVPDRGPVPGRSRLGGAWVMLTGGAVVLVLLLVFILQNGQRVQIHLYGAHWNAPLGVALLMASALGVLLVLVPGAGRIIQLRRTARGLHQDRERLLDQVPQATQEPQTTQVTQVPQTSQAPQTPQIASASQAPDAQQVPQPPRIPQRHGGGVGEVPGPGEQEQA